MNANNELKEFCDEIVSCLIEFLKMNETTARELVEVSQVCNRNTELENNMLHHETPYYWAMRIYYVDNPDWHNNPVLWPPPDSYLKKWYSNNKAD